jgi:Holliday junction resolvase
MPNLAYQRGNYWERFVCADLEANGYHTVQTRGSKSCADIVGLKRNQTLLIQAKSGEATVGHEGWNALYSLAHMTGAVPIVAERGPKRGVIHYRRITGQHIFRSREWPSVPFEVDEAFSRWIHR